MLGSLTFVRHAWIPRDRAARRSPALPGSSLETTHGLSGLRGVAHPLHDLGVAVADVAVLQRGAGAGRIPCRERRVDLCPAGSGRCG